MTTFTNYIIGCWNNIKFHTELYLVIDKIKKSSQITFNNELTILGDNYYAQKEKKEKKEETEKEGKKEKTEKEGKKEIVNITDMDEGFNKISENIDFDKYIIMGNHDVKKYEKEQCTILSKQYKYLGFNVVFPFSKRVVGKNIFLYIDTTVYDTGIYECYYDVIRKDQTTIATEQIELLEKTINEAEMNTHIFIYGHQPLIFYKIKNDKTKPECIDELLTVFHKKSSDIKLNKLTIHYICADYHVYEYGTIYINDILIKQHIYGTGGTELDTIYEEIPYHPMYLIKTEKSETKLNENPYEIKISDTLADSDNVLVKYTSKIHKSIYGFGKISFTESGYTFSFQSIGDYNKINYCEHTYLPDDSGLTDFKDAGDAGDTRDVGDVKNEMFYRKYLKYKEKYLKLKSLI